LQQQSFISPWVILRRKKRKEVTETFIIVKDAIMQRTFDEYNNAIEDGLSERTNAILQLATFSLRT
jgi:hypothetical protein